MVYRISVSKLNILRECPRCFWLVMKKGIERPSIPMASIIMKIDSITKKYFDIYREKEQLPPIILGKVKGKLAKDMPKTLYYENENILLIGKLDEFIELDDGSIIPFDHKTKSKPVEEVHPAYQLQLDTYSYLIMKNKYKTINKAFLGFYYPDDCELHDGMPFFCDVVEVNTNFNRVDELLKKATEILAGEQEPEGNEECKFCQWRDIK